jgi:hypothetical protein
MNHKFIPAVAAFLILGVLLSATPLTYAATALVFGPKLEVVTIPQDNQVLEKGVIILGIDPGLPLSTARAWEYDYMSQHKIIVTYNGATFTWAVGSAGPTIACNVLEKDKVNVIDDPKTGTGKQGAWENLMTTMKDVSDKFICKVRWKSPATGILESVGVLDVYWAGPYPKAAQLNSVTGAVISAAVTGRQAGVWIADNILVVEAFFTVGRTVVFGSDIQDICVLGWVPVNGAPRTAQTANWVITKPDGTRHSAWAQPMSTFVGCEELALLQRDVLGIALPTGQDPQA